MNGFDPLGAWSLATQALALASFAAAIYARFKPAFAPWVRELILSAIACALSGWAYHGAPNWVFWLSGFFVCAALHRWADAVLGRG